MKIDIILGKVLRTKLASKQKLSGSGMLSLIKKKDSIVHQCKAQCLQFILQKKQCAFQNILNNIESVKLLGNVSWCSSAPRSWRPSWCKNPKTEIAHQSACFLQFCYLVNIIYYVVWGTCSKKKSIFDMKQWNIFKKASNEMQEMKKLFVSKKGLFPL